MDLELYYACQGDINVPHVIELLEAGANINATISPTNTETALIAAIRVGATDIVTLLVERGADVNLRDGRPLRCAIFLHRTDIITYLLVHHADVTLTDNDKYTALHYASIYNNSTEIIPQLLAAGAVVDAKNDQGETPLYHLLTIHVNDWRENGLHLLANGADINTQDLDGNTILHRTIANLDKIRFLLDNGASVEIQNEKGQTPFNRAVELCARYNDSAKYEAILTLLQEHIASQNVKNAGRRK